MTAGLDNDGLTTRIVITNTAVLGRNAQCSTDGDEGDSGAIDYPTLPDPSPLTLWGCQRGTSEVQLWAGTTKLASVTVRVFSLSSVRFDERVGYRFFKIDWNSDPAFVDFSVQWRNEGDQPWQHP